ncbi:helix-turn-helix domain-containing protein [Streptomyces sp. NPDC054861]
MSPTSRGTASSAPLALPSPKERRRLREALALSEDQLAEAMGVTRATVRSWETGRTAPRGRKREAYMKLLGAYDEPARDPESASEAAPEPSPSVRREDPPAPEPEPEPAATPVTAAEPCEEPHVEPYVETGTEPYVEPYVETRTGVEGGTGVHGDTGAGAYAGVARAKHHPFRTPAEAFDALYAYSAPGLAHQTYLLTGRRRLARESVERAFQHAWQRWPEVAVDRDPVGWVRVVAYEYALSPWHRFRRRHKHPDSPPIEAGRRALLAVLLDLPPSYRRTVLLYDGLGLDLPDTAAETEASTPAAANRLLHARTVIGQRIPALADPDVLHRRLRALVAEAPTATLPTAKALRARSERWTRLWTRTALSVTTVLVGATAFTAATAPTQYLPVPAPGEAVNGVPASAGSPRLTPQDRQLREQLRDLPHPGPERLVPDTH